MDVFHDTSFFRVVFYGAGDCPGRETKRLAFGVFLVHEPLFRMRDEERWVDIGPMLEIVAESADRSGREEYDAELRTFAADAKFLFGEIDLIPVEAGEFGDTEAGGKEELEDGAVTSGSDIFSLGRGKQPLDLVVFEEIDLPFGNASNLDLFGGKRLDIVLGEVFQKCSDDDRMIGLSAFLQVDTGPGLSAIEIEAVAPDFFGSNIARGANTAPGEESPERPVVTIDRPV